MDFRKVIYENVEIKKNFDFITNIYTLNVPFYEKKPL